MASREPKTLLARFALRLALPISPLDRHSVVIFPIGEMWTGLALWFSSIFVGEQPIDRPSSSTTMFSLSAATWNEISKHAQETFPEECCGVVFADGTTDHVQRLENIQNRLHALDPQTYPRTAVIAYAMDPKALEAVIDAAHQRGARLKAFYHSHPNHDAYFSEEDKAFASPFGEPTFPGAAQIVVSIYDRIVKRISVFAWSEEKKDFVAVPLDRA